MSMRHWLVKSEAEVFSIDALRDAKRTGWDGVRNYAARNFMRDHMQLNDPVLFYHSSANPTGVAGLAQICRVAYPDLTAFDAKHHHYDAKSKREAPQWYMVDLAFVEKFPRIVSLAELKQQSKLKQMTLFKQSRLSVQPVSPSEFALIVQLGKKKN